MDDMISRQAAIEALEKFEKQCWEDMCFRPLMSDARVIIKDLPAVQSEWKTGRWIHVDELWYRCSECDAHRGVRCGFFERYCPNCGAKMESEETK